MKKKILTGVVMGMMMVASYAQDVSVPPNVLDAASMMFEDSAPPYKLEYKINMNINDMGIQIINYTMFSNDVEIGIVSRIKSLHTADSAKVVDMIIRFTKEGEIQNMINLNPWEVNGEEVNINPLIQMLSGRKMSELTSPFNTLLNGIAAAEKMQDAEALPAPPKDFVLNLKQQILEPGAVLPPISFKFINNTTLSTKSLNAPIAMFFISIKSSRCEEMIKTIEMAKKAFPQNQETAELAKKMKIIYVVGGKEDQVAKFAKRNKLDASTVVADSADQLQKMFKIPFKPYGLMYKDNVLLNNVLWQGEAELLGTFYMFLGGKDDGVDE